MYTQPRFVLVVDIPRFGSRDEYVGCETRVVATAETEGWAMRVGEKIYEDIFGSDVDLRLIDNAPRSDWSPEISEYWNRVREDEKELPF